MSNPKLTIEDIEKVFEDFEKYASEGNAVKNGYFNSVYAIASCA